MRKRINFDLLIIFLLGFLPVIWFPGSTLLFGHDSGMPFDPIIHFLDRFYVWTERLAIGTDQSFGLLGAFPIHGLEALLTWMGFSLKAEQNIQFFFWFVLPGFTMYFFAHKLWPQKKYLPLIASVIYMVNFFLIQAWFVAERTKFSVYAALPILLYFTIVYLTGKTSFKKSVIVTGITIGVLNGGGSFPLYGGLILALGILYLYLIYLYRNKEVIKRIIFFSFGVSFIYFLLNAYWIFTYFYYLLGFYGRDMANVGGAEGALGWASYLSKGSTFLNLFRGQGVPEWYLSPYHAFANNFLTNPILILASFAFPILAYSSLFLVKEKRDKLYIYVLALMSFFGMIFASGPQSQLGIIYETMVRYVPGFAIFRSAFYKFDYVLWFSYGILIGFTLDIIFTRIEKRVQTKISFPFFPSLVLIFFVAGYLLYHYPILTGSFLDYSHEPKKELTTRIEVPDYVFEFGKWMNSQDAGRRYLILPELGESGFVSYKWGYWGPSPISSLMTKNSFVQDTLLVPGNEKFLMNQMYSSFLRKDMGSFFDFSEVFAIDGIVLQKDFNWQNISWGTTDPAIYENILENSSYFKLRKTFGEWKVYDIVGRDKSLRVTVNPELNFLQGELKNVVSFPYFDPTTPLFIGGLNRNNDPYYMEEASDIILAPECADCELVGIEYGFSYYNPKILPGSLLYPLIVWQEERVKKRSGDFTSMLNFYLTTSDRRVVEGKWMIDSKQKLENVQEVFERYYKTLLELKQFITYKNWGLLGIDENKAAKTISSHLLQQANFIESIYDSNLLNIDNRDVLAKAYDEVLSLESYARGRLWLTQNAIDKRYIFDLLKTGTYDVFVKKGSLSDPAADTKDTLVSLGENESVKLKPISTIEDWLYFGSADLNNKILHLEFKDTTTNNLLKKNQPYYSVDQKGINVDFENDLYTFTTDSKNKCLYFPIKNLDNVGSSYIVSFKYRNLTNRKDLGFYYTESLEKPRRIAVKETFLSNSREWINFSQRIFTKSPTLYLYFCNGFSTLKEKYIEVKQDEDKFLLPGQNVIEIEDIVVNRISFPNIVLYKKQKDLKEQEYVIDFKKSNPVSYEINTKPTSDPVTLTMRESYGKYWKVCQDDGECLPFDDKNHFVSAGFNNGWYFKNGIGSKISLYYAPQDMYYIGAIITVFTLIILTGGICWYTLRKR